MLQSILLALPFGAYAQDAFVVLPGLGPVTLGDAVATCQAGQPVGSVSDAAARAPSREAAFQGVARALLGRSDADRKAYWKYSSSLDWPTRELDVRYLPDLEWVPAGVVPSCFAAGNWYAGVGLRTAAACQQGRSPCKEMWPDEDWARVKDVPISRDPPADGRDPYFLALHALETPLTAYRNPQPFLAAACEAPGNAARQARLLDSNDLLAARRACLQQLVLVQRVRLSHLGLPCDTPWSAVVDDDPHVWTGSHSDLGLTDRYRSEQVDALRDRLLRMDPTAAACDAPWAVNWRKDLLSVWTDGQRTRACGDDALALPDRAALCPTLFTAQSEACEGGDAAACERMARMLRDGTLTPADEVAATRRFLAACQGGATTACTELRAHAALISTFFHEALAAAQGGTDASTAEIAASLRNARAVLDSYGAHLDSGWTRTQASLLFEAALTAGDAEVADRVLADFARQLDAAWLQAAAPRHAELVARLQREALEALGP